MTPIYVYAGDVFFTRSNSILGKLIRWAETDPGEAPTWTNHCGVVVRDGWIGRASEPCRGGPDNRANHHSTCDCDHPDAVVIEALSSVRRGPLKVNGVAVRVFGPVPPYTPDELQVFVAAADEFVGAKYGWWKLGFHLLDRAIFKGRKVLSALLRVDKRPICSYLAARVCATVGSDFGMVPQAATPDEMLDYALATPDEWEERV